MECYRQLEGRRGQTATRLQADDAYRPLLHSTLLWPGANTPGVGDMTPGQLMAELIPTFRNLVIMMTKLNNNKIVDMSFNFKNRYRSCESE